MLSLYNPANYNIMVVSDKKKFLTRYGEFFRDCGYNVYSARCSFECAHSYFEGGVRIDLVVLDDDMWRSSAVVKDIMEWDNYADILVLGSEKRVSDDACDTILEGCAYDHYLSKDDNIGEVLKAASSMLRNKIVKYVTLADVVQSKPEEVLANA